MSYSDSMFPLLTLNHIYHIYIFFQLYLNKNENINKKLNNKHKIRKDKAKLNIKVHVIV